MPRRAALPRVLRPRGRGRLEQRARRAVAAHDDLPPARARAPDRDHAEGAARSWCASSYVKVAEYQRRGLVHLHVRHPARPRDARLPRGGDQAATRALHRRAARGRASAPPSARSARRCPTSSAAAAVRWGDELDVRQLDDGTSAARSRATWPSTRPRAPSRPAACCTASPSTRSTSCRCASTCARYMREAFALADDPALADRRLRRHRARVRLPRPLPDQEPPLLHHLQGAARGARDATSTSSCSRRSDDAAQRALAGAVERIASFRYVGRAISQPPTRFWPPRRPRGRVKSDGPRARHSRSARSIGRRRKGTMGLRLAGVGGT